MVGCVDGDEEALLAGQPASAAWRRLSDGSGHRIVKVFHDAASLTSALTAEGWSATVRRAEDVFIVGTAHPPTP